VAVSFIGSSVLPFIKQLLPLLRPLLAMPPPQIIGRKLLFKKISYQGIIKGFPDGGSVQMI
jgi:hypothetical protein